MKKLLLFLAVMALALPVFAERPYSENGANYYVNSWWFGPITDPTDTFWVPGLEVQDVSSGGDSVCIPNILGIDLAPYKYLYVEVAVTQADTTHNDSLLFDIYTGYYGDFDSLRAVVPSDSIPSIIATLGTTAHEWFALMDLADANTYFFQKSVWLRIRPYFNSAFYTDTTYTGAPAANLWSAAGDSLVDWYTANADGLFWTQMNEADWDSFIWVGHKDSTVAMSMGTMAAAQNPGIIDSVEFNVAYWDSTKTIHADTIRLGIAFGDSTLHHYDSLDVVLWSNPFALDSSVSTVTTPRPRDTVTVCFPTDPRGNTWTRTTLDSTIIVLDPVHVDTTSAGDNGLICVYRLWSTTYHNRGELFPGVRGRVTVYLKD